MNRFLTALLLLVPFVAHAAEHHNQSRIAVPHEAGASYGFENLAGVVTVTGFGGDEVIIQVNVVGATEELAHSVTLRQDGTDFWMDYPVGEHDRFIYRTRGNSNTNTTYRGERVQVSSRGRGAEVHAVVQITLPHGTDMTIHNAVGEMRAEGVRADLSLRTGSGRIEAVNTHGSLVARSGSGALAVTRHEGPLELRTGSGSVRVDGVAGDVSVRTGSGSVRLAEVTGTQALSVRTGSGSVRVQGDLTNVNDMSITTGSGSVGIDATGVPDVRLHARAGSGSVRVDVDGMRDVETGRNRVRATLGDGSGEANIRTGSGSIRFTAR